MTVEKFTAGDTRSIGYDAVCEMLKNYNPGKLAADMMRLRISGAASSECDDTYYVAVENGEAIARHWMGWGKHADAIGNWGNFYTKEEFRGRGVGREVLSAWYADFLSRKELPIAFFCTAANEGLVSVYSRFGFVSALKSGDPCPLYLPVGNSPENFRDFCDFYYKPSETVIKKAAGIGWRHEIDCLLRFCFMDNGLDFGINGVESLEEALLRYPERAELFFAENGHAVGWAIDGVKQIHPSYLNSKIVNENQ